MNIERSPADREVLTGLIERVTYRNKENGFCVLRVKAHALHRYPKIRDVAVFGVPDEAWGSMYTRLSSRRRGRS
jgi:hypothetical protein